MTDRAEDSACLDELTVLNYLDGVGATEAVEAHLANCETCRMLVQLAGSTSGAAIASAAMRTTNTPTLAATGLGHQRFATLVEGDSLGRYRIAAPLGSGGMSVVYAAYDPTLDRRVALKLLHGPSTPGTGEQLLQEGRAIARLSHPNVVTVYDLGEDGGQWYVAMELVAGGTLGEWARATKRSAAEIIAMYGGAGRGLAAAHAAGLIHRDFKPANVLVGDDGRPRVSDFGLALLDDSTVSGTPGGAGTSGAGTPGTPAYMAPEQIDGAAVDARADQFSFAVALFEALEGNRPFAGTTLSAIRASMRNGPQPLRASVPRRVAVALRRALSEEPGARFASMNELLRALTPARLRPVHLAALALTLAVGAVGAKIFFASAPSAPCKDLDRGLAGVWDPARATVLTSVFIATGIPRVADTARAVRARLDGYAGGLTAARIDACEAASVRREQTPAQLALRTVCLDERLAELRAATDVLLAPDREVVANAHTLIAALTPPDACADLATLSERLPAAGAAQISAVRDLRGQLVRVRAQVGAGQFATGAAQLAALRPAIEQTAYRPLQAEAAFVAGVLANEQGFLADAERELRASVLAAEAGRDNRTAAAAWILLARVRGRGRGDIPGAIDALEHADATVERLGTDVDAQADLSYARALTRRSAGDHAGAAAALREAARLLDAARVHRGDFRARIEADLAAVVAVLGDLAGARAGADSAIAAFRRAVGSSHPDVAGALVVAASIAVGARDFTAATGYLDDAEQIVRVTVGVEHPRLGQLWMVRAVVLQSEGKPGEATALLLRTLDLFERRYGKQYWQLGVLHHTVMVTAMAAGDAKRARAEYVLASELMARSMAHDSVEALELRVGLAWLLYVEGNAAGAEAAARESADESRRVLGPAHRNAAEAKRVLGYLLAAAGKEAEAIEPYRTAIEISERGGAGGLRVTARYRCELGKALLALKRYPEAISELETAGAIEIKNHSEQTPEARTCRFTLAETYRGVGDHARAVAVLEALVADLGSAPDPRAQMWLGIELAASGGDAKRARSLVAAARTQLPADDEESIRAAAAWLRTH